MVEDSRAEKGMVEKGSSGFQILYFLNIILWGLIEFLVLATVRSPIYLQ